jgi:Tfp pilus assembly major pilin PilA
MDTESRPRRRTLRSRLLAVLVVSGLVGVLAAIAVPLYANV